jgi:hypothetical protein
MANAQKAATPQREWLFKADGQVFGPIPEERLVALIMEGSVVADTEVAPDGGAWQPIKQISGFLVHLRKAEARARVEAEATGARKLAQPRNTLHWIAVGLGGLLLLAGAGGSAWYLAVHRPWARQSELLADFGDGIGIGTVSVGTSSRSQKHRDDEVALPAEPSEHAAPATSGAKPKQRVASASHPGRSSAAMEGGGMVLAQYDPERIQQVVARHQASLAPCVRQEARRSPDFFGDIPIEFAVGNDGRISALWIDDPRFKSGPLYECLLSTLRQWTFDTFPGQRPVVSLSFHIGPPR